MTSFREIFNKHSADPEAKRRKCWTSRLSKMTKFIPRRPYTEKAYTKAGSLNRPNFVAKCLPVLPICVTWIFYIFYLKLQFFLVKILRTTPNVTRGSYSCVYFIPWLIFGRDLRSFVLVFLEETRKKNNLLSSTVSPSFIMLLKLIRVKYRLPLTPCSGVKFKNIVPDLSDAYYCHDLAGILVHPRWYCLMTVIQ